MIFELASNGFDNILKHPGHRFYVPAQWYSSLEFLLNENENQAILSLKDIANGNSEFAQNAQKLLDDLKWHVYISTSILNFALLRQIFVFILICE